MHYKRLGSTDIHIPILGQGCMGVGGYFTEERSQDEKYLQALQLGIEAGLTFIDTAEAYGGGHSEELVGQATQGRRKDVFIATKVSPEHLAYEDVLRAADASLRRLRTDYIDLYQVHWPNPRIPIGETMKAMQHLVDEGSVRFVGLSNFTVIGAQRAQQALDSANRGLRIQSNQVEYNLFDRTVEVDLLPYCEREQITLIAYSPLDKGSLPVEHETNGTTNSANKHEFKNELNKRMLFIRIAEKYDKSPAQVILNWLTSHPAVVAIPKATIQAHILENASAADFDLSPEDVDLISRLFSQPVVYIPTDHIQVDTKNLDQFVPGPEDLAQAIREGEPLKPVRVVHAPAGNHCEYVLVEGKLRYWAWVMAHAGKEPIPALVRRI